MNASSLPRAAASLLPHKGLMCCIDSLVACRPEGAEAVVALRRGHALLAGDGRLEPFGFIELAAQAAGAMHGFQAGDQRPDLAMLVGVQKFAVSGAASEGDALRVAIAVLGELEGMLSLGFAIHKDGAAGPPLAEGRLSVFVPPANDERLADLPRPSAAAPVPAADIPRNLPDSVDRYRVEGPAILDSAEGQRIVEAVFIFTPDFPGFDGHFPGNPIVPGLVQLMAAARTAALGRPAAVATLGRAKFLRPVVPGEKIRARVEVEDGAENTLRCRAKLDVDGAPCAEAGFILKKEGA